MKIILLLLIANFVSGCNQIDDLNLNRDDTDDPLPVIMGKNVYYVSTNGNDNNPGTIDHPWASWQKAFNMAVAGDTIYIRGGTYYSGTEDDFGVYLFRKSGTYTHPVCIFNYPGESPILDCSTITRSSDITGLYFDRCRYIHLKGLTVQGVKQPAQGSETNGIHIENSNGIKFENCISRANAGSGFSAFETDTLFFINCDAYDNFDINTAGYSGGQADGFVVCYASHSSYTYFSGCRSWYNSDDGFDCWENEGIVVFKNSWSFNNGRGEGDGCGFKFGRTNEQPLDVPQRIITHCLAFKNRFVGFNQNGANVKMLLFNNIAYDNDDTGFELSQYQNEIIVKNNINYKNDNSVSVSRSVVHDHNSWDASPSISVSGC